MGTFGLYNVGFTRLPCHCIKASSTGLTTVFCSFLKVACHCDPKKPHISDSMTVTVMLHSIWYIVWDFCTIKDSCKYAPMYHHTPEWLKWRLKVWPLERSLIIREHTSPNKWQQSNVTTRGLHPKTCLAFFPWCELLNFPTVFCLRPDAVRLQLLLTLIHLGCCFINKLPLFVFLFLFLSPCLTSGPK